MSVLLASADGSVQYGDSEDHFRNGVLRLMNMTREDFGRWLEAAAHSGGRSVLERLREGWGRLHPPPAAPGGGPGEGPVGEGPRGRKGRLLHPAIAETPTHGVAVADAEGHGWLVKWDGEKYVRETEPPRYEEEYFEGDKLKAGGYGDYTAQAGWRLQKARRQVRELRERTGLETGRVLDVGSGYGFFRVALGEAGFAHDGVEVSQFARKVAEESYGLKTYGGTLGEHAEAHEGRYDAVTLYDLIEHVEDPERTFEEIAAILRPGGMVGVKTPNIDCPEATIFGPHYHSLKREHLSFFSPESLTAAARTAGLKPVHVTTTSHLLTGFVGPEETQEWEHRLRGADVVAWYRRAEG
jgi:2-polyprenyl-3-methyl-5-hydroxy-6-metoxy-1,4-benzoquinol methylase